MHSLAPSWKSSTFTLYPPSWVHSAFIFVLIPLTLTPWMRSFPVWMTHTAHTSEWRRMEGWGRDEGGMEAALWGCWASDLHPGKAVCWLRFHVFLPLTFILAKNSAINSQIYIRGEMSARLQAQEYTPPTSHTHIQVYAYVDTRYPWKSTTNLDTDTQVALTRPLQQRQQQLGFSPRSCLSPGPAPLPPPSLPASLSGSITLHHQPRAPGYGPSVTACAHFRGSGISDSPGQEGK